MYGAALSPCRCIKLMTWGKTTARDCRPH
uniref:Uncharacterized protein n=1 Tax=Anguilla anguilla TaxID=7936 RepID=A0A0E9UX83_ANGAN